MKALFLASSASNSTSMPSANRARRTFSAPCAFASHILDLHATHRDATAAPAPQPHSWSGLSVLPRRRALLEHILAGSAAYANQPPTQARQARPECAHPPDADGGERTNRTTPRTKPHPRHPTGPTTGPRAPLPLRSPSAQERPPRRRNHPQNATKMKSLRPSQRNNLENPDPPNATTRKTPDPQNATTRKRNSLKPTPYSPQTAFVLPRRPAETSNDDQHEGGRRGEGWRIA